MCEQRQRYLWSDALDGGQNIEGRTFCHVSEAKKNEIVIAHNEPGVNSHRRTIQGDRLAGLLANAQQVSNAIYVQAEPVIRIDRDNLAGKKSYMEVFVPLPAQGQRLEPRNHQSTCCYVCATG